MMYDNKIHTWFDVKKMEVKYKIVLFGAGKRGRLTFIRQGNQLDFDCVIDNDPLKQERLLKDVWEDDSEFVTKEIIIRNFQWLLNNYNPSRTIVILAIKDGSAIESALYKKHYENVFSSEELDKNTLEYFESNSITIPQNNHSVFIFMNDYGDHGKYITNKLLEKSHNIDIIWGVEQCRKDAPPGVVQVKISHPVELCNEFRDSKIIIMDNALPYSCVQKPRGQLWIQVKHWSSITLKKFYLDDCLFVKNENMVAAVKYTIDNTDFFFVGSKFDEDTCRKGFNFNGVYKHIGSPRSDGAFCNDNYIKIRKYYHIKDTDKIILYAPTFRHKKGTSYGIDEQYIDIDFGAICKELKGKYNENYVFLLRLHPAVKQFVSKYEIDNNVINVSEYSDAEELVAAADILISDYSSVMFEAAFIKRPIFLYAPDLDEYLKNERQLLIDYNDLPFPVAKSNNELLNNIRSFSKNDYLKKLEEFLNSYGVNEDGHASERAAKFILDLMG